MEVGRKVDQGRLIFEPLLDAPGACWHYGPLSNYVSEMTSAARSRLGRAGMGQQCPVQDREAKRALEALRIIRYVSAQWDGADYHLSDFALKERLLVSRALVKQRPKLASRFDLDCLDGAIRLVGGESPCNLQSLLSRDMAYKAALLTQLKQTTRETGSLSSDALYRLALQEADETLAVARRAVFGVDFREFCPLQLFVTNLSYDDSDLDISRAYHCLLIIREGNVIGNVENISHLIQQRPHDAQFIEYFCIREQTPHLPWPNDDRLTYIAVSFTGGDPSSLCVKQCLSDKAENDREIADYRGHLTSENEVEKRALGISAVLNCRIFVGKEDNWFPDLAGMDINHARVVRTPETGDVRPPDFEAIKSYRVRASLLPRLKVRAEPFHRLFIRPIGDVCRVPFEALPLEQGGQIGQLFAVLYVKEPVLICSGDDLRAPCESPLIVGHCDFDLEIGDTGAQFLIPDRHHLFEPIGASGEEARSIHRQIGGRLLESHEATKAVFLSEVAQRPSLIHIATHAFFCDRQRHYSPAPQCPAITVTAPKFANCSYSAIVFSGANAYIDKGNLAWINGNAILEISDIINLDLHDTNLVVLSACETGIGTVELGQESEGLREAFLIAGAKCVLSSLWPVLDQHTKTFMCKFYEYFSIRNNVSEALRLTRCALRHFPNAITCAFIAVGTNHNGGRK